MNELLRGDDGNSGISFAHKVDITKRIYKLCRKRKIRSVSVRRELVRDALTWAYIAHKSGQRIDEEFRRKLTDRLTQKEYRRSDHYVNLASEEESHEDRLRAQAIDGPGPDDTTSSNEEQERLVDLLLEAIALVRKAKPRYGEWLANEWLLQQPEKLNLRALRELEQALLAVLDGWMSQELDPDTEHFCRGIAGWLQDDRHGPTKLDKSMRGLLETYESITGRTLVLDDGGEWVLVNPTLD